MLRVVLSFSLPSLHSLCNYFPIHSHCSPSIPLSQTTPAPYTVSASWTQTFLFTSFPFIRDAFIDSSFTGSTIFSLPTSVIHLVFQPSLLLLLSTTTPHCSSCFAPLQSFLSEVSSPDMPVTKQQAFHHARFTWHSGTRNATSLKRSWLKPDLNLPESGWGWGEGEGRPVLYLFINKLPPHSTPSSTSSFLLVFSAYSPYPSPFLDIPFFVLALVPRLPPPPSPPPVLFLPFLLSCPSSSLLLLLFVLQLFLIIAFRFASSYVYYCVLFSALPLPRSSYVFGRFKKPADAWLRVRRTIRAL